MWGFFLRFVFVSVFSIALSIQNFAQAAVTPILVESTDLQIPILLFASENESPSQAWARYLRLLQMDSSLFELFQGKFPHLSDLQFRNLSNDELSNSSVLIGNDPQDFTLISKRIKNFKTKLSESKNWKVDQNIFVLAPAADLGLSRGDARSLRKLIAEQVPLLVAMGGADVDPRFYRQENSYSINLSTRRDQFEIALIQEYLHVGDKQNPEPKGFLIGVCRGAQVTAVALGYELIQDIPKLTSQHQDHQRRNHDIRLLPTQNNLFAKTLGAAGALVEVNSYHHQSVRYRTGGPLEVAALSEDRVVEALEHKSGRALLLQFHPEMMSGIGQNIFDIALKQARAGSAGSCQRALL